MSRRRERGEIKNVHLVVFALSHPNSRIVGANGNKFRTNGLTTGYYCIYKTNGQFIRTSAYSGRPLGLIDGVNRTLLSHSIIITDTV